MINKELSPNEYFYFSGSKFLRSLQDLMNCMQDIDPNLFSVHVNEQRNDFASWVRGVFGEPELAEELQKLSTPVEYYAFLKTFLITKNPDLARKRVEDVIKKERRGMSSRQIIDAAEEELEEAEEAREAAIQKEKQEPRPETKSELKLATEEDRFAAVIESFNTRLDELKKKISVCRKEGKDAFIPDLMLRPAKAKISIAKVTKSPADLQAVEDIFLKTEEEIIEVEKTEPLNVKQEIDHMVRQALKADRISKQVKEIMIKNVVTLPRNVPASAAAKLMADKGIGCVVIAEGETPIGIITERDIVKRAADKQINLEAVTVGSIMTTPIVTIGQSADILEASELMKARNFRRLAVTEGTKLVGLVTQTDLLKKATK